LTEQSFNPGQLTVLVVDDQDPIRKGIKRILAKMEFTDVIECFDGQDAIKLLEKRAIDLVISDIYMRKVGGYELLSHIRGRELGSDIPVILVTGEAGRDDIVKSADLGADDYLIKPFQTEDLEKKIITVLNRFHSPTPALRLIRQAERSMIAGAPEKSIPLLQSALKLEPKSYRARYGIAVAKKQMGKLSEALVELAKILIENPSYYRAFRAQADIYIQLENLPKAVEAMKSELELNPKQVDRQAVLAKLLLKIKDVEGAIHHYRIALKENPKLRTALLGMGHAYARNDNLEKALYYFKRVRRYHPGATAALEAIVKYCRRAGVIKRAEHMLKDERNSFPKRTDTYLVLGDLFMTQEREQETIEVLDTLLELSPDFVDALLLRGRACMKLKKFKEAAQSFEAAIVLNWTSATALLLGDALICDGQSARSVSFLETALCKDSHNSAVAMLLAKGYWSSNDLCKSWVMFRKAASLGADAAACNTEARNLWNDIIRRRKGPEKIAS